MTKNRVFTTLFLSLSLVLVSFATPSNEPAPILNESNSTSYSSLYQTLNLSRHGLSETAFENAVKGYEMLLSKRVVANNRYLTIVDFSQSSRKRRFYLLDMKKGILVHKTFVSHGKNSGLDMAEKFSNQINSEQSSLGFFITSETYSGKHGLSLRLSGQEAGINDNAETRGIVIHGADYVNAQRVYSQYMGRSQGCPALPEAEYAKVIELIKNGSVMFLYHPSKKYIKHSPILNS